VFVAIRSVNGQVASLLRAEVRIRLAHSRYRLVETCVPFGSALSQTLHLLYPVAHPFLRRTFLDHSRRRSQSLDGDHLGHPIGKGASVLQTDRTAERMSNDAHRVGTVCIEQ